MVCLPIELLDVVIDILKHDSAALKTLSLVHSAFTRSAHKHLFNHITISGEIDDIDNDNSILVTLSNAAHAHLLDYIHKLTLVNDTRRSFRRPNSTTQFYSPNSLIPIFIDAIAPHLHFLSLKGIAPGWDASSNIPLKDAIIRVLTLPPLTHFDLDRVNRFPTDLLNIAVGLQHLRFATPYPNHPCPNIPLDEENISDPIYLDSLDIDIWFGEIPPTSFMNWLLDDSRLSVSRLRSLSINGFYTKKVGRVFWKLVEACSNTLLHLSIGPDHFNHDVNYHTLHCLRHLLSVQCKAALKYQGTSVTLSPKPFEFFTYVLSNLPPSSSTITNLDIVVQYTWTNPTEYQDMDMTPWIDLAEFLIEKMNQGGSFDNLKEISVGIVMESKYKEVVTPRDVWKKIRKSLVLLSAGGSRLNHNGVRMEYYEASTEGWLDY